MSEEFLSAFGAFDLVATFLLAVTGALAAMRKGWDFVGVLALAFVTGTGGGLLRDGLFLDAGPAAALTDQRYLFVVILGALAAFVLRRVPRRLETLVGVVDAAALGTYAVVGSYKSLVVGLVPLAAALVGVVNAVGGGVLRDVLSREEPFVFRPGQYYAAAAMVGSSTFVALVALRRVLPTQAAVVCIALVFVVRLVVMRFDLRTAPVHAKSP
ncbi:MAG: TRIC cation channel family protein [Polyangiales bacterium]